MKAKNPESKEHLSKATHLVFGLTAEEKAREFLENKGYQILEKNYRYGKSEIDILAKPPTEPILVVVEVKARKNNPLTSGLTAINKKKQNLLIQGAEGFLQEKNLDLEVRFDVISMEVLPDSCWKILHIEDAFGAYESPLG